MDMWHFNEYVPGEIVRQSHEQEFFEMDTKLEAVVREAVQNSLDASLSYGGPVKVRFLYARAPAEASVMLEGLEDHLTASGIRVNGLGRSGFDFMAIEDFNTSGLSGDTSYNQCLSKEEGNFCNFWWVDGSMRKDMMKGGRWGLGKYTFFAFSNIKLIFGASKTDSDRDTFLMGRILLKKHEIKGKFYSPDGVMSSESYDPVTDHHMVENFEEYFMLERKNLKGLSLVIPYPDLDHASETFTDTTRYVLENYLYSVLSERLEVTIESKTDYPGSRAMITASSLNDLLKRFSADDRQFKHLEKLTNVFREVIGKKPQYILPPVEEPDLDIESSLMSSLGESAKRQFSELTSDVMKIRVPFYISYSSGSARKETYVDISVTRNDFFKEENIICLRNGIKILNGIRNFETEKGLCILTADDEIVSGFLGDAENPSHTEWIPGTERLRGKYSNPKKVLDFIKNLPKKIITFLSEQTEHEDREALIDLFYVPVREQTRGGKIKPVPPRSDIPSKPLTFILSRSPEGFRISLTEAGEGKLPRMITVRMAYDTADGNPFKKYSRFDFDAGDGSLRTEITGGKILSANGNTIQMIAEKSGFNFSVSGFDGRRDLVIDVKHKETDTE
jgi:hypothetical protein